MEKKNDGGPAFPTQEEYTIYPTGSTGRPERRVRLLGGMTLLDYFAGQALAGILSRPLSVREDKRDGRSDSECIGVAAYQLALAMLKAREG